jgi:mannose-6-phosphate isomerase-like protein (cupin superfamily)
MRVIKASEFSARAAWDALDIETIPNATIRLHWTDQPYIWHVNDGPEVFVVLAGAVDMQVKENGAKKIYPLVPGDIFHAEVGDEHKASPKGEARILVIETAGSV